MHEARHMQSHHLVVVHKLMGPARPLAGAGA